MDSNDKQKSGSMLNSFSFAIIGIWTAIKQERNMRFHLCASIIVLLLSYCIKITAAEWLFVIVAIGGMFALELVNSAIERVVDLVTADYHYLAKQAKDLAAGAVFVYALVSLVIGLVIFLPYVLKFF